MLPTDLENAACRAMEDVFDAGHRVRLAAGKSTEEWKSKTIRKHLAHAIAHLNHVLGSQIEKESDLLYVLDEETKTPELGNALLRVAMAIYLCGQQEEKETLKAMPENEGNG